MWDQLKAHHTQVKDRCFETLLDAERAEAFSVETNEVLISIAALVQPSFLTDGDVTRHG